MYSGLNLRVYLNVFWEIKFCKEGMEGIIIILFYEWGNRLIYVVSLDLFSYLVVKKNKIFWF